MLVSQPPAIHQDHHLQDLQICIPDPELLPQVRSLSCDHGFIYGDLFFAQQESLMLACPVFFFLILRRGVTISKIFTCKK